jgi:sec-independent protein translocase protein TatA
MIGTTEILIICGVVLLLFGASAIPKFARSLGKARKEFEEGIKEGSREANSLPKKEEEKKEN